MKMVYANGFPKCGNHALVRALELLGVPDPRVHHLPYPGEFEGEHVFIKRDPRDVIVSWLRHQNKPVTPGTFLSSFRYFGSGSLVDDMRLFEGWLEDGRVYVLRFEDLLADSRALRNLAAYLELPYYEGAFEHIPGPTITYNEKRSDYRDVWSSEVQKIWASEGGSQLLDRWGY